MELVAVDDDVLEHLVQAAISHAAANEMTPAVTAGPACAAARNHPLTDFHRERRAGLDGPAGEVRRRRARGSALICSGARVTRRINSWVAVGHQSGQYSATATWAPVMSIASSSRRR